MPKPNTMIKSCVIFDLDGTLIDSAPSILASIKAAFNTAGLKPAVPLSEKLIGPPLAQTLTTLLGEQKLGRLPELIINFKNHYDEIGWRDTRSYEGIEEMLQELADRKIGMCIATNKRILPTRLIVQHLGWDNLFMGLYSLDCYSPPFKTKTRLLQKVSTELELNANKTIYVGDRKEDAEAAKINALHFIMATWGYGDMSNGLAGKSSVKTPSEIIETVEKIFSSCPSNFVLTP